MQPTKQNKTLLAQQSREASVSASRESCTLSAAHDSAAFLLDPQPRGISAALTPLSFSPDLEFAESFPQLSWFLSHFFWLVSQLLFLYPVQGGRPLEASRFPFYPGLWPFTCWPLWYLSMVFKFLVNPAILVVLSERFGLLWINPLLPSTRWASFSFLVQLHSISLYRYSTVFLCTPHLWILNLFLISVIANHKAVCKLICPLLHIWANICY